MVEADHDAALVLITVAVAAMLVVTVVAQPRLTHRAQRAHVRATAWRSLTPRHRCATLASVHANPTSSVVTTTMVSADRCYLVSEYLEAIVSCLTRLG